MSRQSTIFISSTSNDLASHREQLLYSLNKMRQRLEAMEYFGARPGLPIEECIESIQRSDIYVLILGMRYGSVDAEGVSITQREYDAALKAGKQVFCYLMNERDHAVVPENVETGINADKLKAFKEKLRTNHICEQYVSAEDLAVKVVTDIVRYMAQQDESFDEDENLELAKNLPAILIEAGYSPGMTINRYSIDNAFRVSEDGRLTIENPLLENTFVASYIATNLCDGNFNVLKGLLTFDKPVWDLIIILTKNYGIDEDKLARFIEANMDPAHVRLLVVIAGALGLQRCTEAICKKVMLPPSFYFQFWEQRAVCTPLQDVFKETLTKLCGKNQSTIQKYHTKAKKMKNWKAKSIFETALKNGIKEVSPF